MLKSPQAILTPQSVSKPEPISSILSPRTGHSVTLHNSTLYCFGGATHEDGFLADLFHSSSDAIAKETPNTDLAWTKTRLLNAPLPRYEHFAFATQDSLIIMWGSGEKGPVNDIHSFNFKNLEWTEVFTKGIGAPSTRVSSPVYSPENNRVYVWSGGVGKGNAILTDDSMYCLDLKHLIWVKLSPKDCLKPKSRMGHTMTLHGDLIYLFGGMNEVETFSDLWVYSTKNNNWTEILTKGDSPARCGHTTQLLDDCLVVVGGMSTSPPVVHKSVFIFDTGTTEWRELETSLDHGSLDHAACLIEDKIAIIGGMDLEHVFGDLQLVKLSK